MPDVERLLAAIDAAEDNSYKSDDSGDLAEERARNIDYYLGRNILPAPDGRSNVQDSSVYDTVQWMKPSLARIFAGGDDIVRLPPVGPEDEEGSKQESEYLNHIILQKNDWFGIFDTACTDALTVKAAYLHPYIERRRQIERETYTKQTPESLAMLLQDKPEILSHKEYPDPDYEPTPQPVPGPDGQPMLDAMGQPVMVVPPPPMLYDVEIRRTKVETHYCIIALPPERCKIAKATNMVQLNPSCPYFEYYDYPTLSELRADGYTLLDGSPIPDDIGQGEGQDDTLEDTARNRYTEIELAEENTNDPAMRRVKCRWVWIRHDYDGDGIAELQHVVVVAREVLHREEVNRIPVGVLCPDPVPHRHIGNCPADKAGEIQAINTVLLRQGIDNLQLSNNPQKFGDPQKINFDDAKVSRPGGLIRTRGGAIFGQDFGVLQVPPVFQFAIEGLQYMDHVRQKRTGVGMSFQGLDPNQLAQLQPGTVNQVSSMEAQRVEYVARHFANGIVEMCSILHELVLKSGHQKEVVKLRGNWVQVDPSNWRTRTDFRIAVGYSAGNKDSQMARINMLAAMQKEALVGGLRICTEENAYNTAIELTKAADFPNPDAFWTDPKSLPPPSPPKPDPTVLAMEQIKAQSADNVKRMDVEQKERDSVRDFDLSKYKTDVDAQVKLLIAQKSEENAMNLKRFDADATLNTEMTKIAAKNQPANEMAGQVQELANQLSTSIESLKGALQVLLTAKRQIRRGKDRKPEGVDIVAPDGSVIASQSVVRDADGSIAGTQ